MQHPLIIITHVLQHFD